MDARVLHVTVVRPWGEKNGQGERGGTGIRALHPLPPRLASFLSDFFGKIPAKVATFFLSPTFVRGDQMWDRLPIPKRRRLDNAR